MDTEHFSHLMGRGGDGHRTLFSPDGGGGGGDGHRTLFSPDGGGGGG